ncbi:hypothetical protein acdb102_17530 [Acidothermaceae bacterium B102]|nr:hypothetical protein acdb102_17530 [Acidothermaceae bacterium B102]
MRRTTVAAAMTGLLVAATLTAAPAEAAKAPVRTTISAHLTPATSLVNAAAVVSGTVSPKGGTVLLQRLVGKKWQTLTTGKVSAKGAFSLSVRSKTAAIVRLRVIRAASKTAKAGVSSSVTLHVVPTGFLVAAASAPVTAPAPLVVTGSVAPKATGAVQLQRLTGATWATVATATLTSTSAYSLTITLPAGPAQLRVVKPYTTKVAAGTSTSLAVTVQPAVAAPSITTTVLAPARVGQLYLAALTAAGGTGPYTWSATGLPSGLALSAAGILAGTPVSKGSASIATTATDAAGRTASVSLTLAIAEPAGRLFAVGSSGYGLLGNGAGVNSSTIVPVVGQSSVTAISSGTTNAVAADADGSVWAWGDNTYGSLGTGNNTSSVVPVRVLALTDVIAVTASSHTDLALKADGTLWSWGNAASGQLGDGTTTSRSVPAQVTGVASVVAIAGGGSSFYALRNDGTVWAWGLNGNGQLGDGTIVDHAIPAQVPGLTGITAIAAGTQSAYALRSDGSVFSWGDDSFKQLGDGGTTQQPTPKPMTALAGVTAIAAGSYNGYALTASGTVLAWGNAATYGLGNGGVASTGLPVAVHTLAGVMAISSSAFDGEARLADGSVWSWGYNTNGQLGDGTSTVRTEPVAMLGVDAGVVLGTGQGTNNNYVIAS